MIHGAICDSDFFSECGSILSKQFCVICYDRRGYSRSSLHPGGIYSIEAQAEDAATVLKHYASQPAFVVACSAGAEIALKLAMMYPHLVRGIILHEPPVISLLPKDEVTLEMIRKVEELVCQKKFNRALFAFTGGLGETDPRGSETPLEIADREYKNSKHFLVNEFSMFLNWREEIHLSVPIVLAVGERSDPKHYCVQAAEVLRDMTNGRIVYFPGKHNAAREVPLEFACMTAGIINLLASFSAI